jgi:hypothetical protein
MIEVPRIDSCSNSYDVSRTRTTGRADRSFVSIGTLSIEGCQAVGDNRLGRAYISLQQTISLHVALISFSPELRLPSRQCAASAADSSRYAPAGPSRQRGAGEGENLSRDTWGDRRRVWTAKREKCKRTRPRKHRYNDERDENDDDEHRKR